MNQLETRSEKLSPSILTRGSSQCEEGRGRIEKNLFSARELSPHLRNCDKFTSTQKEPIRAQCKAEGSTPRETAKAKEAHRCECGFKSPLATHTVGLRKNTKCKQTQKRVKTVTIKSHCSSREMNKKQIVLEKSARLNLDPGRGDRVDGGDGRSFARGWSLRMIICKRPVPPDDHLQEAR